MAERPPRRFNMLDALVLIAATALGLVAIRLTWEEQSEVFQVEGDTSLARTLSTVEHGSGLVRLVEPGLVVWTLALLILRLRSPRPAWRRLMLQPGFIVEIVTVLMLVVALFRVVILCVLTRAVGFGWSKMLLFAFPIEVQSRPGMATWAVIRAWFLEPSSAVALGVLSVWLVLALGRRCRPERNWIDRAGRLMGVLWFLAAVSTQVSSLAMETWFQATYSVSAPTRSPEVLPPPPPEPKEFEMPPLPESIESY